MIKQKMYKIKNERGRQILLFVFCLFLAFIIWSIHKLSESYTVYLQYRVTASASLEGRVDESVSTNLLIVRGKATGFYILQHRYSATGGNIRVSLDNIHLRRRASVKDGFYVQVRDVSEKLTQSLGPSIFVESFATDTLFYVFQTRSGKKVPVKPNLQLSFESQYDLGSKPTISPDYITIYGEREHIATIDTIFTKPVKFDNLSLSTQGMIDLVMTPGVRYSRQDVSYSIEVVRYVEKSIKMPLNIINVPDEMRVEVTPSEVTIYYRERFGSEPLLPESIRLIVDYDEFKSSLSGVVGINTDKALKGVLGWRIDPQFAELRILPEGVNSF